MPKVTRAILAGLAALRARLTRARRAEGAGGHAATPSWKRYAASTALLLMIAALVATILLTSGLGPQPASATEPCANGTVVPSPADNPGLVADCALLLAAKDTLRGTATLNWSAERRLNQWTGITVGTVDGVQRVTVLNLDRAGIDGTIPPELGRLTGLRELQLAWRNQLTGSIPAELGQLTRLTDLNLAGNRLTGPIPPELGAIGPQLTDLILSGPRPLPEGVGLTGSIPPQLGNLTGLADLYLDGNRLTGSIPTRLGRLVNLSWLYLARNQLSGSIPTQLGNLTNLDNLRLEHNRLTGSLPTQLTNLDELSRLYLKGNSGISGCVPPDLRDVRTNDLAHLSLPDCAADAPATPETPLPTYTLTVTAAEGGSVSPAGTTTHDEAAEVTLTASWNDATHTFGGWGGDCSGAATTCVLELYANKTVTATFTSLPADRCAAATDADCIRAVYKGAPDDYAQVQDIPADVIIQPDAEGRYQVERGQQITVVTAAQLPAGYTRFYLQQRPLEQPWPVSFSQLIPPVGTTYTFTVTSDERGASPISFDLTAARPRPLPRPGQKPELGEVVVTTEFVLPLMLELMSSRELCTANTLTELSWSISGGRPPYALTIEGETVDADAESHRVNCGPIPTDPFTDDPLPEPKRQFSAAVTDSQAAPASASGNVQVDLALPLPAPSSVRTTPYPSYTQISVRSDPGSGLQFPNRPDDLIGFRAHAIRYRRTGSADWRYATSVKDGMDGVDAWENPGLGAHEIEAASVRHPLEIETPAALSWSRTHTYTVAGPIQNASISAISDAVTVTWDAQPNTGYGYVTIASANGWRMVQFDEPSQAGTHTQVFAHAEPDTDYTVEVYKARGEYRGASPVLQVRTKPAPEGWTQPPAGPQNLRASVSRHPPLTCLSIEWDAPHPNADPIYDLMIIEVETGLRILSTQIWDGTTSYQTCGEDTYRNIEPSKTYHILVTHTGIREASARISVSTAPSQTQSRSADSSSSAQVDPRPLRHPFRPLWPVRVTNHYAYTDDPFDWRTYSSGPRYHAALDIGGESWSVAQNKLVDASVRAIAGGTIRILNDGDPDDWGIVYYCPDPALPIVEQFGANLEGKQCNYVLGASSGRTALIFHAPDRSKVFYVSKYAHLKKGSIPAALVARLGTVGDDMIDPAGTASVRAGDRIGGIGNSGQASSTLYRTGDGVFCRGGPDSPELDCSAEQWERAKGNEPCAVNSHCEHAFIDPHLHFEIRRFKGSAEADWYNKAEHCAERSGDIVASQMGSYCGWSRERQLHSTILDPEQYLSPLPASHVPRDAGLAPECPAFGEPTTKITCANPGRRVFEVTRLLPSTELVATSPKIELSIAVWRPAFYSRFSAPPFRFILPGIRSTLPGVHGYYTHVDCSESTIVYAPIVHYPEALPESPEGEIPRVSRTLELTLGSSCPFGIYTRNDRSLGPSPDPIREGVYILPARADIELSDPAATVRWSAALEAGADQFSAVQTLVHDDHDLFTFRAVPGKTYRFCTTTGDASTTCVDEGSEDRIAELLIVGPAEGGQSGVVVDGAGLTRGANGLEWGVPASPATVETYAVVVRRRARFEGGEVPQYTYRLKYTVPAVPTCDPDDPDDLLVLYCIPPAPVISGTVDRSHDGFIVNFSGSHRATRYQAQITGDVDLRIEDVEDGANARSHPFSGLQADTEYTVRVRGLNQTGASPWSAPMSETTLVLPYCIGPGEDVGGERRRAAQTAQCRVLAPPTSPSVSEVTDATAKLSWSAEGSDLEFELHKVKGDDCNAGLPSDPGDLDRTSSKFHVFPELTQNTFYRFCVRATRSVGEAPNAIPVRSQWASATARTLATPPPTTPTVTIGADATNASSEGDTALFTVTRTGSTGSSLAVDLSVTETGSMVSGTAPTSVTILSGASTAQVSVHTVNDSTDEPSSTITMTVVSRSRYEIGSPSSASVTVADDDPPPVVVDPPNTKICWDGSVIPVVQDCPPPPCGGEGQPACPPPPCGGEGQPACPPPPCGGEGQPACPPPPCGGEGQPACPPPPCGGEGQPACPPPPCGGEGQPACPPPPCGGEGQPACPPPPCGGEGQPACPPPPCGGEGQPACPPPPCGGEGQPACPPPPCGGEGQPACPPPPCGGEGQPACPPETKMCPDGSVIPVADPCPVPPTKCETEPKPADYSTMPHPPIPTVEYQWITIIDIITFDCTLHQQQRTTTTTTTYHVTFSCDGMCWVSSVTSSSTSVSSGWASTGVTSSCNTRRSATGSTMTLTAGSYEMQWGDQRIVFTVPVGATVELSRRQQESGDYVAVLSMKKGAELVVGADALSGDDQARATRFADTTDPTLSAIAASLRDPTTEAPEPSVTTTTECAVAEASDDGQTSVDLDANSCAIVRQGGPITVALGGESLAVALAAGREWLILDGTGSDEAGTTAAIFVDLLTGGYITLALTDGSELARHIPEGNTDLPALFDAMTPAAPADDGS